MSGGDDGGRRDDDLAVAPRDGTRFLFELAEEAAGGEAATYRAAVLAAAGRFDYEARLAAASPPALRPVAAAADPALESMLSAIAGSIARAAARRRADGLPPWPRRVLRWRGPGRGA
jgi:hypothetical protein